MSIKEKSEPDTELTALRKKAVKKMKSVTFFEGGEISSDEVNTLFQEVQVMQLELEMQNEELKASYETLEEEKRKFSNFFDLAPVGYLILDNLAIVRDINQNGLLLLKVKRAAVMNKRFQNFVSPTEQENFHHFLYKMHSSKKRQCFELKLWDADTNTVTLQMEGIAVATDTGGRLQYYITFQDITASLRASEQLRETKNRLEMTLQASLTGVWSLDIVKNHFFMDESSRLLLDVGPFEFDGHPKNFLSLIDREDHEKVNNSIRNTIFLEKDMDVEFKRTLMSGEVKYFAARGQVVTKPEDTRQILGILMDITDKKKLQLCAEHLKVNQQKMILDATLKAQEKERKKISETLHDSICQLLYGIKLNVQSLQGTGKILDSFKNLNKLIDQSIKETRAISYELTPSVLNDFGFKAGIKELVQRINTPKFNIGVCISDQADDLPFDLQLSVFRILQELINNSMKHAEASVAKIEVSILGSEMKLQVSDNGKGVGTDKNIYLMAGSGIRGVKNRVYLLNGDIQIETAEHKGMSTTITFNIEGAVSSLRKQR